MACNDSSVLGPQQVWTKNSNTAWLWHGFGAPMSTADFKALRASIENKFATPYCRTRVSYRLSNDGETWDAPVALYTSPAREQTGDGTTYGDSWITPSTDAKLWIWIGAEAIDSQGVAMEMALVAIRLDKRSW
jgi:hypothetical protein